MTKLVFIHVPIRNMYFLSGMEGFKKSEGRSTRGASSLQNWLRPPPQNWMRPYDSCSSAPTALMKKLSTANLLSIHVLILRIFVFGGATRIVGAGSRQSQIGLCKGVLLANPLPGASGLGKLTTTIPPSSLACPTIPTICSVVGPLCCSVLPSLEYMLSSWSPLLCPS